LKWHNQHFTRRPIQQLGRHWSCDPAYWFPQEKAAGRCARRPGN
jgi:hypothetical protein